MGCTIAGQGRCVEVDCLKLDPVKFGDRSCPKAIAARQLDIAAQSQPADQNKITRIERIILVPGSTDLDVNGNPFPNWPDSGTRRRIAELEAQLAGKRSGAAAARLARIRSGTTEADG